MRQWSEESIQLRRGRENERYDAWRSLDVERESGEVKTKRTEGRTYSRSPYSSCMSLGVDSFLYNPNVYTVVLEIVWLCKTQALTGTRVLDMAIPQV